MNIDFHKPSHILFFAAILPFVSFGVGWAFVQIFPNLPFWVEGISPLGAYGLLFGFFDKIAWHWPLFRWLGIVTIPDVRGRWLGTQTSSFTNAQGKHLTSRVIMEVTQTFSGVQVKTYYKRWSSQVTAAQFIEIDRVPTLLIMFDATPKVAYEDAEKDAHKGVTKLIQKPDGTLEGTYFNAAGRHGELSYTRMQLALAHTFEALKK